VRSHTATLVASCARRTNIAVFLVVAGLDLNYPFVKGVRKQCSATERQHLR
jgi:hypothetical protein